MTKRKVYISSTYRDLSSVREKIIKLITDQNVLGDYYDVAYIMENMRIAGNSETAIDQCLEQVNEADVYILIIGSWYGSLTTHKNKEQSYTQHEFDQAIVNSKKRIYILHSTDEFDLSIATDIQSLCNEKKITLEENTKRLREFKSQSTLGLSSAIFFNSENNLLDEINKCFIGDIAYYYLKETLANTMSIEPKLKWKIDRITENTKLKDGMKIQMNKNNNNAFKVLTFSKPDDKPDYYSKRIALEKCGSKNPEYIEPFRSSSYISGLTRFNTDYNLLECIELLRRNEDFNINHQINELKKSIIEKKSDYTDIIYFEVSEIELNPNNEWINFINCFHRNLISHYENIANETMLFIYININYKKNESLDLHSLFNVDEPINLGSLGKINTSDVLLFLKNEVLKINDDDSESQNDKREQFKRFENGINQIQLQDEFTYYGIEKYLF